MISSSYDGGSGTSSLQARFARSREIGERLHAVVPGGAHTYSKGEDQFPGGMAPVITHGKGSHVWDVDGNEFVEYASGLRGVTLGHAHPRVTAAVRDALDGGTNFVRPALVELEAAEALLSVVPAADMVKFTKNGSDATSAAIRLARAVTGRDLVAFCRDQPFFSTDDWFIGATAMSAGIPKAVQDLTLSFPYGDLGAAEALLERHSSQVACLIMEPAAAVGEPPPGYYPALRRLCDEHGTLLVLDEMITGFRWTIGGAQALYGVEPDLSTFGKGLGNGFPVSALVGKRAYMERGGIRHDQERVFLLSTTHGAEVPSLAAAIAVIETYRSEPVIETLHARGERLAEGVRQVTEAAGVDRHLFLSGRPSNLVFATLDADGARSQLFRTLFMQELIRSGVLAPSFVVSAALTEEDIDVTIEAVAQACTPYRRALEDGPAPLLEGASVKPVFRSRA